MEKDIFKHNEKILKDYWKLCKQQNVNRKYSVFLEQKIDDIYIKLQYDSSIPFKRKQSLIRKQQEINKEIELLKQRNDILEKKIVNLANTLNDFAKKHYTFTYKQIADEFEKACKKFNFEKPKIDFDLSCEISHSEKVLKTLGSVRCNSEKGSQMRAYMEYIKTPKGLKTLINFVEAINKQKRNDFIYLNVESTSKNKRNKNYNLLKQKFTVTWPLDFDMELLDGTKLRDNVYADFFDEQSKFPGFEDYLEYFTDLKLNEDAKEKMPIVLNFISIKYDKVTNYVVKNLKNIAKERYFKQNKENYEKML